MSLFAYAAAEKYKLVQYMCVVVSMGMGYCTTAHNFEFVKAEGKKEVKFKGGFLSASMAEHRTHTHNNKTGEKKREGGSLGGLPEWKGILGGEGECCGREEKRKGVVGAPLTHTYRPQTNYGGYHCKSQEKRTLKSEQLELQI